MQRHITGMSNLLIKKKAHFLVTRLNDQLIDWCLSAHQHRKNDEQICDGERPAQWTIALNWHYKH